MKSLIITIVGPDKVGLVKSLAQTVAKHQGNWLASNFVQMAGRFAGFAEIHISEDDEAALASALQSLPDLDISLSTGEVGAEQDTARALIEVTANDRKGIVQELTSVLNQFDLNIDKLETQCDSAPNWGNSLFKAQAKVSMARDITSDQIVEALEAIADDLMVDVSTL